MVPSNLRHFKPSEFRHPELVNADFVNWLDSVRDAADTKMILTSDARLLNENRKASGSSSRSLHLSGWAVDMRLPSRAREIWNIVAAVVLRSVTEAELQGELRRRANHELPAITYGSVELELVHGPTDRHIHVGIDKNTSFHELILADD